MKRLLKSRIFVTGVVIGVLVLFSAALLKTIHFFLLHNNVSDIAGGIGKSSHYFPETEHHEKLLLENDDFTGIRCKMDQQGAMGSVTFNVRDANGNPLSDADVDLYFSQPENTGRDGKVSGKTNSLGLFSVTKKTNFKCFWRVSKKGFHASQGDVVISSHFSKHTVISGKWTEKPIETSVILKPKSGVNLLRGRRIWNDVRYPTNTWVGFDFTQCDCVEPYGKGKTAHISFRSKSWGRPPFSRNGTYGFTNTLEIAVSSGGLEIFTEDSFSSSPFQPKAPSIFSGKQLRLIYAINRVTTMQDDTMENGSYIIFRINDEEGDGEFHCGIMRRLEFGHGWLRFEYFFNQTSNDNRIDGEITAEYDLGR